MIRFRWNRFVWFGMNQIYYSHKCGVQYSIETIKPGIIINICLLPVWLYGWQCDTLNASVYLCCCRCHLIGKISLNQCEWRWFPASINASKMLNEFLFVDGKRQTRLKRMTFNIILHQVTHNHSFKLSYCTHSTSTIIYYCPKSFQTNGHIIQLT